MENKTDNSVSSPRKGRPRSEASRRAVLAAALALVQESGSGRGITVEAIARRAGVGKQTVYRWWGGPGDIFLEILRESASREIDDRSADCDLRAFLANTFQALNPPVRLILKTLMAEAALDARLRAKFVDEFISRRRRALSQAVRRSGLAGDETLLVDLVFGFMWYRLLLDVGPLDVTEGAKIADLLQAPRR